MRLARVGELLLEQGPTGRAKSVEANGLSEVSLGTLGELLGVGEADELADQMGVEADGGEAGIRRLPTALAEALTVTAISAR